MSVGLVYICAPLVCLVPVEARGVRSLWSGDWETDSGPLLEQCVLWTAELSYCGPHPWAASASSCELSPQPPGESLMHYCLAK